MLSAALALVGAVVYGSADFLGGIAARRLRSLLVTPLAAVAGLVPVGLGALWLGASWIPADVAWGALSGVTGAIAVVLLYACLALGPMSILSPLAAVVSAIVPMVWGLVVLGETLPPLGYAGLAVALVAVVLVGFVPGEHAVRPSVRGLAMATGAGVAIGAFLIIIDGTSAASGVVPLVLNRGVNALITGAVVAVVVIAARRRGVPVARVLSAQLVTAGGTPSGRVDVEHATTPDAVPRPISARAAVWLAIGCGLADASGNVLTLAALRAGDLAIVSALTALYPAGTILLASIVLRERIARVQAVGLALALGAGVLLAVA